MEIKYKIVITPLTKVIDNECVPNYQLTFLNISEAQEFLDKILVNVYLKYKESRKIIWD